MSTIREAALPGVGRKFQIETANGDRLVRDREGRFVAKLAQTGGLAALLQPFAALYVLILATFAPLLAKESERLSALVARVFARRRPETTEIELGET